MCRWMPGKWHEQKGQSSGCGRRLRPGTTIPTRRRRTAAHARFVHRVVLGLDDRRQEMQTGRERRFESRLEGEEGRQMMEAAILVGIGLLLCGWAFAAGKREGSRKAFHVGRECAKRVWRRIRRR